MKRKLLSAVAMVVLGILLLAAPTAVARATGTSPTPAATPGLSLEPLATMPPQEEFFEGDDRTQVADYENPAYTADDSDDPAHTAQESTGSYLGDLLRDNADTMDLVVVLTLLGLIPSIVLMMTGFTRIIIVLSFVRNAIGTNNMPPNQVLIGIALFVTFFVMFPIISDVQENALEPYNRGEITITEAMDTAMVPIRDFMLRQTYKEDLSMFISYSGETEINDYADVPTYILIPAFITSEVKHAFLIGFFIYLPFIVIDMIVASTLMSMGMMMLPPVMISLPFKVLLFVAVDGWNLVIGTLIQGFL